jgi:hypothetical protein
MSERLYSEVIEKRLTEYFHKYGWSIMRGAYLQELLNEAYKEGQASVQFIVKEEKQGGK